MSTSLLYHGFGVRGYRYQRTDYGRGEVVFAITQPRQSYRCAVCGSEDVTAKGTRKRRFRTVPIGGKRVYLDFAVPRVECAACGAIRQVKIGFADSRVTYTRLFERYALELSGYMTIKDVADHLGITWAVIKLYNDKLSDLRRDLYRQLQDTMQKDVLKGVRWLLLKRPENLDPSRKEPERLGEALRLNEPLAIAYHLKEELHEIWEQDDQDTAAALLMDWITYAESTGIRILQRFARTLRFHAWGILAWYDHPISTGPLEGTNNKIKTMKRQAYGFRDPEFLKLKILGIHEARYALVG